MKDIVTRIEESIQKLKSERKDLDEYVFTITPEEYKVICEYWGVAYDKCTIFNFMGVKMYVTK
jgi:hypothetical protein